MIPSSFQYKKANSVAEALQLLADCEDAQLLAGGHSLIPAMKLRLNAPGTLVDISKIAELNGISEENGEIVIGAMTTHGAIANSELVQNKIAMFAEAAGMIGDIQVRNAGTIGGSIAHADPAADWPALLLASDTMVVLQSASGSRSVVASDFFTGFFETALEEGEIVTQIRIPIPAEGTKSTYKKFVQPASRFAIVGCAVMADCSSGTYENVKVAFTGVAESAFRDSGVEAAMNGQSSDGIADAAAKAADGQPILGDHFASEEYRKHLATVFAKRALKALA